ncbi:MAG: DNA polymerase, partial [Planctomycetaceae bacterium]
REARTGREIRVWQDGLATMSRPPFRTDARALFVSYAAPAEFSVFHALGWPAPARTLDLYVEFRALTNRLSTPSGSGLLGALVYHGLDAMDATEKTVMRDLAIRGGPYTDDERRALLDYCAEDVHALERLLPRMLPRIDLPRALLRGRYGWAVAAMEHRGIPIDVPMFHHLRERWGGVQAELIAEVDARYGVYEGKTFKRDRFAAWLVANNIPWPRLPSGELDMEDGTFRSMAKAYPVVAELRELRSSLGKMRLFDDLAIGPDGRNRTAIMPFRASTGRNQPSNAKFIFGPSRWLRSLIKPEEGRALAYIDYGQQEFAIAAALSGDTAMMEAYRSGDPYLAFGKQAGAIPPDGTKATHKAERDRFKACVLAVQYGMGFESLAERIGQNPDVAKALLNLHRRTYPTYWRWSEAAVDRAMLLGRIVTVFGWPIHVGPADGSVKPVNARSLANFPCQANGAEMLRIACCLLVEGGIELCAPIHDAVLIEGPADSIDAEVEKARAIMAEASRIVLTGFEVGTDVAVVRYPDRYVDEAGVEFWNRVTRLAGPLEGRQESGCSSAAARM